MCWSQAVSTVGVVGLRRLDVDDPRHRLVGDLVAQLLPGEAGGVEPPQLAEAGVSEARLEEHPARARDRVVPEVHVRIDDRAGVGVRDHRAATLPLGAVENSAEVEADAGDEVDAYELGGPPLAAAIFDLDGLLVDSEPIWHDTEVEVFAALGLDLSGRPQRETKGLRVDEVVKLWRTRFDWGDPPDGVVVDRIVSGVAASVRKRGELLPGAIEAIAWFRRHGLPVAIASASTWPVIDAALETFGLRELVDLVHSGEDEPYGKPHPAVFLTTAAALGVAPTGVRRPRGLAQRSHRRQSRPHEGGGGDGGTSRRTTSVSLSPDARLGSLLEIDDGRVGALLRGAGG